MIFKYKYLWNIFQFSSKKKSRKKMLQREKNNAKGITKYVNIFLDLTLHYNDIKTFYLV